MGVVGVMVMVVMILAMFIMTIIVMERKNPLYSPSVFLVSTSQDFKFVYFNQMNLAQKTTVHNRKTASATISPEMVRLISDINADFTR